MVSSVLSMQVHRESVYKDVVETVMQEGTALQAGLAQVPCIVCSMLDLSCGWTYHVLYHAGLIICRIMLDLSCGVIIR